MAQEPRVYIDQLLSSGERIELADATHTHLVRVLRLADGAAITLFDGSGQEFQGRLSVAGKRQSFAEIGEATPAQRESPRDICLALCISKGDRMDWAIQKAVELGVRRIIPVISERTVVRVREDRWAKKAEHWHGVMISACEQSGRVRVPVLSPVRTLDALDENEDWATRWMFSTSAQGSIATADYADPSCLLIGPEGGLSANDERQAERRGFTPLSMGPRILRTETAAVVAIAAIQLLHGDYR